MDIEKNDLDYKTYVQTDDEYEDFDKFDKIKNKAYDLQFFGIEADSGIVMTCLQKALLYHGLDGEKFVLLALYATRPSLSTLKIRANAVRKSSKMTWTLRFEPDHDDIRKAVFEKNMLVASVLWIEKTHFVAISLDTNKHLRGKEASRGQYLDKKGIKKAAYMLLHAQLDPNNMNRHYYFKLCKYDLYDEN